MRPPLTEALKFYVSSPNNGNKGWEFANPADKERKLAVGRGFEMIFFNLSRCRAELYEGKPN